MRLSLPFLILIVSACQDERPPVPTAEESARLDEADALLDDLAANQEGPADNSAGPSSNSD